MTSQTTSRTADKAATLRLTAILTLLFILTAIAIGELLIRGASFAVLKAMLPAQLAWEFSRATAVVGYLLLTTSMVWGLILSTRISKEITPPPTVMALHNALSWAALGLAGLHAVALLLDTYFTYTFIDLLIPFMGGPYKPFWVGVGVLSFYGLVITTVSFSLKGWLSQKAWRRIHLLTFAVFIAVTAHGFMAGTDSSGALRWLYPGSIVLVVFLTNYRLIAARRGS